jgi:hypothetical protein
VENIKVDMEKRQKEYDEFIKSLPYTDAMKYFNRFTNDFLKAVQFCVFCNLRNGINNSLLFYQIDMIFESIITTKILLSNGSINPIKRELRFALEATIKYLFIDIKYPQLSTNEKTKIYNSIVSRSKIDEIDKIEIFAFDIEWNKEFINETRRIYSILCKFVHPSEDQIANYQKRLENGSSIGFESLKEVTEVSRIMFQTIEIIFVMILVNVGPSCAGDVCVYFFDEYKDWKLGKGKFLKHFNAYFDYKIERQKNINA